jgi:hypothetical protein
MILFPYDGLDDDVTKPESADSKPAMLRATAALPRGA